jgi:pimeloyl-ACP methyl ester carboxylesterase
MDTRGRLAGLVLLNAVGIAPDHPDDLTDTRTLTPVELGELAFRNTSLRLDPAQLDDGRRAVLAANQRTLAVYSGAQWMYDPKLRPRLRRVDVPVLVLWGEQDGVATPAYGRAYASAFPRARFVPVPDAGHFPHMEQSRTR